ncbi:hypothetical protein [Neosynechococcus sphagnicola]|uniref:hypothetical protein n=1 Tax=Neosynechococcus sphagnicola TaxID=1501145 RepID=UPI00068FCF91|nr:hypothetical protein [Neosynechococcus sphagnicola]
MNPGWWNRDRGCWSLNPLILSYGLLGFWALAGAIATGLDWGIAQYLEEQVQTIFLKSVAPFRRLRRL